MRLRPSKLATAIFLTLSIISSPRSYAIFSESDSVKLDNQDRGLMIVKVLKQSSSYQGIDSVFYFNNEHGYVLDKETASQLPIKIEMLAPVFDDLCGECYPISNLGDFYIDYVNLTSRFFANPDIAIPESQSLGDEMSDIPLSSIPAGWANFYLTMPDFSDGDGYYNLSVDGSQTISPEAGNIEYRFRGSKYSEETNYELETLAYSHHLSNQSKDFKIGKFYDHEVNGFSDFYGIQIGTPDTERHDTSHYDAHEFDIKIDGPGEFTVYNGDQVMRQGTFTSNRLQLTDIRASVDQGLKVKVIDRYGKEHIFESEKGNVTGHLKPYTGFWDLSIGYDAELEDFGAGVDLDYGLPYELNTSAKASLQGGGYYLNVNLEKSTTVGSFEINSLLKHDSREGVSTSSKNVNLNYNFSTNSFYATLEKNLFIESATDGVKSEKGSLPNWRLTLSDNIPLAGLSSNYMLSVDKAYNGNYSLSLGGNIQFDNLYTNATVTYNNNEYNYYLNFTYRLGRGVTSNTYAGKNNIRETLNYNDKNLTAGLTSSYNRNTGEIDSNINTRYKTNKGSLAINAKESDGQYRANLSLSTALAWQSGHVALMPTARDGLGLIETDHSTPEDIEFSYGGYDYNLAGGYSLVPISGNYATNINLDLKGDEVETLSSDHATLAPRKWFGDKQFLRVVSGGALIYSDKLKDEIGVLVMTESGKRYPYYEGFGMFVEGVTSGTYPVKYTSTTRGVSCEATIEMKKEYQELKFEEIFGGEGCQDKKDKIVGFSLNNTSLTKLQLKQIDSVINKISNDEEIVVVGHTCSIGSEAVNKVVGMRRANAARDYLISKGISGERIKAISMGESAPISEENEKNRRVEIIMRKIK